MTWHEHFRVRFPDGMVIVLESMPSSDTHGGFARWQSRDAETGAVVKAGVSDSVNDFWLTMQIMDARRAALKIDAAP